MVGPPVAVWLRGPMAVVLDRAGGTPCRLGGECGSSRPDWVMNLTIGAVLERVCHQWLSDHPAKRTATVRGQIPCQPSKDVSRDCPVA